MASSITVMRMVSSLCRLHTMLCILLLLCISVTTSGKLAVITPQVKMPNHMSRGPPINDMIRRLNPDGKEIRTHAGDEGFSDESPCGKKPRFPVGKPTVVTLPTPTGDRNVIVYIPESYSRRQEDPLTQSVALLLLFHGLNDNCENFIKATGFMPYADRDGFILVSACGSWGMLGVGWNAGMCCGFSGVSPDDVKFSTQIVQTISEGVCVDPMKILAAGFSNGAMISEILGCHAPDVFRAVASVGGIVELRPGCAEGLAMCDALVSEHKERSSVLMIHGDSDRMVPWGGTSWLGFPDIPSNVEAWRSRNHCPVASQTTINTTHFVNTVYTSCGTQGRVEVVRALGGSHEWPERDGFSTTEYIYMFGKNALGSY